MNTKHLTKGIVVILLLFITSSIYAQTYREIKGWSKEINERIETFLNTTLTMNIRKVAVGWNSDWASTTLFGGRNFISLCR